MLQPSKVVKGGAASGYDGAGPIGLVALARQGYREFLAFPTVLVAAFMALAALTLWMDNTDVGWIAAGRAVLGKFIFVKETGTASVLGQLLGGLLTVISITFSVLLLAVQQTATSLSNQVYSQFLRRRVNQLYFGFFLGLAVYDVAALAAAHPQFNPVYTACTAVAMTTLGLCLLILLVYSTVDQMRPAVIIESLRDHTLRARVRSRELLARTRRRCASHAPVQATVFADNDGFLQHIDLGRLERALAHAGTDTEVELLHSVGTFIAYDDRMALVRAADPDEARRLAGEVKASLRLRAERDLQRDAAFGVVQLESIGWTTASSAKSAPEPPRLVINALRDVLGRWIAGEGDDGEDRPPLAVVYADRLHVDVIDALTTIGLAANESLQHVVLAAAFDALGKLLPRARGDLHDYIVDTIRTLIPALSDLTLTARLREALEKVQGTLEDDGAKDVAGELDHAIAQKEREKGRLRA